MEELYRLALQMMVDACHISEEDIMKRNLEKCVNAALAALQSEIAGIKCKLPNTVSVPYPQLKTYNPEVFQAAAMEAYEHLIKESSDRGLTCSNLSERRSVLAIGECESDGSIINTIGHELLHVVAHICEQDGIDMLSEEPCYMMGTLCEKFFDVSRFNV